MYNIKYLFKLKKERDVYFNILITNKLEVSFSLESGAELIVLENDNYFFSVTEILSSNRY